MNAQRFGLIILCLGVLVAAAQLFQPDRTNPPENPAMTFEAVAKPSPEVASIIQRACRDCHSYNTKWPWYSRLSPVSWLLADHVKEGRQKLNFSEWHIYSADMSRLRLKQACTEVKAGEMPVWNYKLMHSEARLSEADIQALCGKSLAP